MKLKRHWRLFLLYLQEALHHRGRALVWFFVNCSNVLILLLFWWALAQASNGNGANFSIPSITTYYLLMVVFSQAIVCHVEEDVAVRDVYKGNLHGYLLKPYSYILMKFHDENGWRLMRGALGFFLLFVLAFFFPIPITNNPWMIAAAFASVILGSILSFCAKMVQGLLAIWLTNIRGLEELITIIEIVAGGFTIPILFFSEPWRSILLYLPFAAVVYYPVEMLRGGFPLTQIPWLLMVQAGWALFFFFLMRMVFRKGVLEYTGAGQ